MGRITGKSEADKGGRNKPKGGTSHILGVTSEGPSRRASEESASSMYPGTISFNHHPETWAVEPT